MPPIYIDRTIQSILLLISQVYGIYSSAHILTVAASAYACGSS